MNTVRNLKINRKARCLNKKVFLKLAGVIAIGVILISIPIIVNDRNKENEELQTNSIVAYYGEDSVENKIIQYINISEEISKLNLSSFNIDEAMYKRYNISEKLKSPEQIRRYIEDFKKINSYISSKDIVKQCQNIDIILNLALQEKFVNSYIYNIGYSTANKNITNATKKYAAEVFGIEDPNNVYFDYYMESESQESNTSIINKTPNKCGIEEEKIYNFDNIHQKKEEKAINNGVISMVQTDVYGEKIKEDNEFYNVNRNNVIRKALSNSIDLENQVDDYDLYNEKMANKMK